MCFFCVVRFNHSPLVFISFHFTCNKVFVVAFVQSVLYTHTGMRIHKRTHARCTHTLPCVFMSLFGKRTEMLPRAHIDSHSLCTECEHRARGYKCLYFFVALKSKVNLTHRTSKQASKRSSLFFFYALKTISDCRFYTCVPGA